MTTAIKELMTDLELALDDMRLDAICVAGMDQELITLCEEALGHTDMIDEYLGLLDAWKDLDNQLQLEELGAVIEQRAGDKYRSECPAGLPSTAKAENRLCPCCEKIWQAVTISDNNNSVLACYRVEFLDNHDFHLIALDANQMERIGVRPAVPVMTSCDTPVHPNYEAPRAVLRVVASSN